MDHLINKFEKLDMNGNINLMHFIEKLKPAQGDIIFRLYYTHQTVFLVDLLESLLESEMIIKILGNLGKNGKRETYSIKFDTNHGTLACDCKDYLFRCSKRDLSCKHITYLLCKVLCIFDPIFFNTQRLNVNQIEYLKHCLYSIYLWKNKAVSIKYINEEFKRNDKSFESNDKCPICYDPLEIQTDCLSCEECHNFVHTECMKIWLERSYNCVYCRSSCWINFNAEFA
jgi:hypothetical protein